MLQALRRLIYFERPATYHWIIYFGIFAILHIPAIKNSDGVNAYLLYAQSLTHGHITLQADGFDYMDMIAYNGEHYLPYPPFPALVLIPFVLLFGSSSINTVAIALICSCLNLYLLYRIFERLNIANTIKALLIPAFFFGTGYWYVLVTSHHVYQFAHIIACSLSLLVINEVLGKQRWWLIGLLIGCSFFTRQFTICYAIFALGYLFYLKPDKGTRYFYSGLLQLGITLSLFGIIYLWYNYVRFGSIFDSGYNYITYNGVLKERVEMYGVFSYHYLPFNFYSMFLKGFNIIFTGKGLMYVKDIDLWGTSLLAASPFVIASIKAKWPRILIIFTWIAVLCMLTGILFYHNNGYNQVNAMRFALDFMPLLIVLTALGCNSVPHWLLKYMVYFSISLNIIAFAIRFISHSQ